MLTSIGSAAPLITEKATATGVGVCAALAEDADAMLTGVRAAPLPHLTLRLSVREREVERARFS